MKRVTLFLLVLMALTVLATTARAQSIVKIVFYDSCKDSVVKLPYQIDSGILVEKTIYRNVKDSSIIYRKGCYTISFVFPRGNYKGKFGDGHYQGGYNYLINIDGVKNYTDTIELPRVTFCSTGGLHDSYYKSYTCNELSNGHVIDYYKNGAKRSEADYIDGWPVRVIKYYDRTGKLMAKAKYDKFKLRRFIWYSKEKSGNL